MQINYNSISLLLSMIKYIFEHGGWKAVKSMCESP